MGREDRENMMIRIMAEDEAKAMKARVRELKRRAWKALTENGSSYHSLSEAARIRNKGLIIGTKESSSIPIII